MTSTGPPIVGADEAVAHIRSGDQVYLQCAAAVPSVLLDALVARAPELHDVSMVHLHTEGPGPHLAPEMAPHFRHRALFIGPNARKAVNEGGPRSSRCSSVTSRGCSMACSRSTPSSSMSRPPGSRRHHDPRSCANRCHRMGGRGAVREDARRTRPRAHRHRPSRLPRGAHRRGTRAPPDLTGWCHPAPRYFGPIAEAADEPRLGVPSS